MQRTFNWLHLEVDKLAPRSNPDLQVVCCLRKLGIDLVLDVGANEGQFASAIRSFGYSGRIVSFEPLSSAHGRLVRASKRDPRWEVHPRCALGDYDGEVMINVSNYSVSSSILEMSPLHLEAEPRSHNLGQEKVDIFRLDSLLPPYLAGSRNRFLKIDTQGFEWQVLHGGEGSLSAFTGILCELSLVALYQGQRLWLEIIEHLRQKGFGLYALQPGFVHPLDGRTLQVNAIFCRPETGGPPPPAH